MFGLARFKNEAYTFKYHPAGFGTIFRNSGNTECAEQFFKWLGSFEYMCKKCSRYRFVVFFCRILWTGTIWWTDTKLWTLKHGSKSIQTSLILRQRPPKPYKLLKFFICFVTTVKSRHAPTIWKKLRWKSLCLPCLVPRRLSRCERGGRAREKGKGKGCPWSLACSSPVSRASSSPASPASESKRLRRRQMFVHCKEYNGNHEKF